jgi:hypothetical protein
MSAENKVTVNFTANTKDLEKALSTVDKGIKQVPSAANKNNVFDIFSGKAKEFEKVSGGVFGNVSKSIQGLGEKMLTINPIALGLGAAIGTAFATFKMVQFGEQLEKVESVFRNTEMSAGISSVELRKGLDQAAAGLLGLEGDRTHRERLS